MAGRQPPGHPGRDDQPPPPSPLNCHFGKAAICGFVASIVAFSSFRDVAEWFGNQLRHPADEPADGKDRLRSDAEPLTKMSWSLPMSSPFSW
jgi:hypothetical protein